MKTNLFLNGLINVQDEVQYRGVWNTVRLNYRAAGSHSSEMESPFIKVCSHPTSEIVRTDMGTGT